MLGTDLAAAEVANRLLEELWKSVVRQHEEKVTWLRDFHSRLGELNGITGTDGDKPAVMEFGPVWLPESLMIAETIRTGRFEIEVHAGPDPSPVEYVQRIASLRKEYPMIAFVPRSSALYAGGQQFLKGEAQIRVDEAREMAELASCPVPAETGQSLYEALDAYGRDAVIINPKEHGRKEAERAERLKQSHPDIPLPRLGLSALQQIANHWNNRPLAKRTGKPIRIEGELLDLFEFRRFP